MVDSCRGYIQHQLLLLIREKIGAALTDSWEIELDPNVADGQTLLFHYPVVSDRTEYVQSFVRLEWGSRSDSWPTNEAIIRPYVAEAMPLLFSEADCRVVALDVKRTFWEKATILHEEAHRHVRTSWHRHADDAGRMAFSMGHPDPSMKKDHCP